jgi:hypothetical protein
VPTTDNPQDFNRFSYVKNNPVRYTDPSGHASIPYQYDGGGAPPPPSDPEEAVKAIARAESVMTDIANKIANRYTASGTSWHDLPGGVRARFARRGWTQAMYEDGPNATSMAGTLADPAVIAAGAFALWRVGGAAVSFCVRGGCAEKANHIIQQARMFWLRMLYEREVRAIGPEAERRLAMGQGQEYVARWAQASRRALGIKYKDMTPPAERAQIYARNIRIYGDPLGPTIQWFRERGRSWSDIIASSARPGGRDMAEQFFGRWGRWFSRWRK